TTSILSSANPVGAAPTGVAAVLFAVVVKANNSGLAPTGTVTLTLDGATVLNNAMLDANGQAFYSAVLGVAGPTLTAPSTTTHTSSDPPHFRSPPPGGAATYSQLVLPAAAAPAAAPKVNLGLLFWKVVKVKKNGKTSYSLVLTNLDPNNVFVGLLAVQGLTSS